MTDEPRNQREMGGDHWQECLEDATAIANEYRERGWDVVTVSSRDVTPWTEADDDGRSTSGFSVLAPDDEFDALRGAVDRGEARFDAAEIYRRVAGSGVLTLAVELDSATETAAVIPLYYRLEEASEALESALERGELLLRVRPTSHEDWVTFTHDDPALFAPDDENGR